MTNSDESQMKTAFKSVHVVLVTLYDCVHSLSTNSTHISVCQPWQNRNIYCHISGTIKVPYYSLHEKPYTHHLQVVSSLQITISQSVSQLRYCTDGILIIRTPKCGGGGGGGTSNYPDILRVRSYIL